MTDARAEPDPTERREPWPWWLRLLHWLYGFLLGPFLTRHENGDIRGAMTRWAVAIFTWAMYQRMTTDMAQPLGWAETFAVFFILFALPIDGAMTALAKRDPGRLVESVTGMFGRGKDERRSSGGSERPHIPSEHV